MKLKPLKEQPIVCEIKKTSQQWYEELYPTGELIIYGTDGWDRRNFHYSFHEELITVAQFTGRIMASTCVHYPRRTVITGTTE